MVYPPQGSSGHASGPEHEAPADAETGSHRVLCQASGRNSDFGGHATSHTSRPPATPIGKATGEVNRQSGGEMASWWVWAGSLPEPPCQRAGQAHTDLDDGGRRRTAGSEGYGVTHCDGVGGLGGKRQSPSLWAGVNQTSAWVGTIPQPGRLSERLRRLTLRPGTLSFGAAQSNLLASTGRRSRSLMPSASTPSPWRSSRGRIAGGSHPGASSAGPGAVVGSWAGRAVAADVRCSLERPIHLMPVTDPRPYPVTSDLGGPVIAKPVASPAIEQETGAVIVRLETDTQTPANGATESRRTVAYPSPRPFRAEHGVRRPGRSRGGSSDHRGCGAWRRRGPERFPIAT